MKKLFSTIIMALAAIVIFSATSCTPVKKSSKQMFAKPKPAPVTGAIIAEYKISATSLKSLQYFSGPDSIVLQRNRTVKGSEVGNAGKIRLTNIDAVDRIVIRPFTPGVCVGIVDSVKKIMRICFSENKSTFLIFGPSSIDPEHTYVLYSIQEKGSEDNVRYGTDLFEVVSGIRNNLFWNPEEMWGRDRRQIERGRTIQ